MTTAQQPDLDLRWFFPLFMGGWLAISCLLSLIGGWHALAQKYRSTVSSSGKLFSFEALGLGRGFGPVSYRGCLFVRLDSAGIGLSIFPLFRFFHPRLFIPWSAVSDCKQERFFFMNCTAVYISEPPVRMLFRGRLGRELYEYRNHVKYQVARPCENS
jgi:hypothetical protein